MTKWFPTEIFTFVSFIYRLGTQFLVGNHFDGCDHAIACVKYFTMGWQSFWSIISISLQLWFSLKKDCFLRQDVTPWIPYTCWYLLMNVFLCKFTYGVVSYIGFFSELALAIVLSDDITDGDEGVVFVQLQALEKAGSSSAL